MGGFFLNADTDALNREHEFFGEVFYDSQSDHEYIVGPGEFSLRRSMRTPCR